MALQFLADHYISHAIMSTLRDANHDTAESGDCTGKTVSQPHHLLNGDFADIVTYPRENYQGIVTLQMRNQPETLPRLMARLTDYLRLEPNMEHDRGKLLVIEAARIRIRQ